MTVTLAVVGRAPPAAASSSPGGPHEESVNGTAAGEGTAATAAAAAAVAVTAAATTHSTTPAQTTTLARAVAGPCRGVCRDEPPGRRRSRVAPIVSQSFCLVAAWRGQRAKLHPGTLGRLKPPLLGLGNAKRGKSHALDWCLLPPASTRCAPAPPAPCGPLVALEVSNRLHRRVAAKPPSSSALPGRWHAPP